MDETKFSKQKYNRGHTVEGVWIFCMVERSADRKNKVSCSGLSEGCNIRQYTGSKCAV